MFQVAIASWTQLLLGAPEVVVQHLKEKNKKTAKSLIIEIIVCVFNVFE